ncbi:MAG: fabH [Deltaproteobacteria bacterium]|nr:fabH [Deltaproteobacteria bacterium]
MGSAILALGHHLPSGVDCAGVRRPIAVEAVGPSTLAARAATSALERAQLTPERVDFIIFATMTPDVTFPGSGCFLQQQLGCGTVGAVDVRAQCTGFLLGLSIADASVRTHTHRHVLVAGAEVHSAGLDYSGGAEIAGLFGDAAGVALIGPATGPGGIRGTVLHMDGRAYDRFWCEFPASRQHPVRLTMENFRQGKHFPVIDFEAVRRFGNESLQAAMRAVLQSTNTPIAQVDCFIISHVLPDVSESAVQSLGIPSSRVNIPALQHGHLTAAALPVALSEQIASGQLGPGATVCLAAAGAGLSWGAAVVTL